MHKAIQRFVDTNQKPIGANESNHRTGARIVVNVPVEISTIYHKGSGITERTYIEDISDSGCRFTMQGAIRKGDTVAVHLLAQDGITPLDEPAKVFEVMWIARGAASAVVGARILGGEKLDMDKMSQNSTGPISQAG